MSPMDIRRLLESYCLDEITSKTSSGSFEASSQTITLDTVGLLPYMKISGDGIPDDAYVLTVEDGYITISADTTASGEGATLTFTYHKAISDDWLVRTRDYQVIPVVERFTGFPLSGTQRTTEYYSGTGSSILILSHKPLVELHSITLITNPQNWVYVSPSSVEMVKEEGILKLKIVLENWSAYIPAFPRGKYNIKVDYTYGMTDVPDDVDRAVTMLTASQALAQIGTRTGGGSLSVQGYGRNYGSRGKYTDYRQELDRWSYAILRNYASGVTGS